MSLWLLIYLADISSGVSIILYFLAIGFAFRVFVCILGFVFDEIFDAEQVKGSVKGFLKYGVPILFLASLLPSKETIYYGAAAYAVESVATTDRAHNIANESFSLIEELIGKYRDELNQETTKAK